MLLDVHVAGDLAVGDGAEVVSDDHIQDDFSILDDDPNIITSGNTAFAGYDEAPSFCLNFMYTSTDKKWTVSPLMILDHANAPVYTFREVLEWACSVSANCYAYNPIGAGLLHSKNVDALINSVQNGNNLLPFVWKVYVYCGASPLDVICLVFVAQLLSLLQNPNIMRAENVAINMSDPLKPYFVLIGSNVLGETISGSVYCKAYNQLITDSEKQLFVPIIQLIDCISVTGNDCFSLMYQGMGVSWISAQKEVIIQKILIYMLPWYSTKQ